MRRFTHTFPQRISAFLLCLALCLGLLPSAAFALDGDKAIMLGTSGISGYDSTDGYDYIYFGSWTAQDTYTTSGPIKWRVLDDQTNTGENGLFLLSEELLGTGNYGGVYFQQSYHYDSSSGSYHKGSAPANGDHTDCLIANAWQGSDAQTWCATFYSSNFSTGEQGAVIATTKSDAAFTSSTHSFSFAASENILNGDKVFFLSAQEAENSEYGFTNDAARIANYGGSAGVWWLRSPYVYSAYSAGVVSIFGYVYSDYVRHDWAARPAFNLDLTSVLFTSAAVGGKIPAASSGGNQGGEAADAIFEIGDYDGSEWKLTLLDKSRNFAISNATINGSGDTVVFSYSSAQTGTNEYISVVIADNGEITYYGRILQLDGTTNGTNGTASFTLPAGVTLSDTTKLYIFNEQYNGGENDDTKLTDYASQLIEVNPAIDDTAPTLTAGNVSRDSATEATVKFISDEAGSYYYTVVESGVAEPSIDTTEAGISCDTTEQTISLTSLSGAGAKDIYIVAKDAAGNVSQPLKITIPAIYTLTVNLNGGSGNTTGGVYPTGEVVNIDAGSRSNYRFTGWTTSNGGSFADASSASTTFTMPAADTTITANWQYDSPYIPPTKPDGPTTGASDGWEDIREEIGGAEKGDTITIDMNGETEVPAEIFEEVAGKDVTVEIDMGDVTWTVNGQDVPTNTTFTDLDLGVDMDTSGISVDVINTVTGELGSVQITLAHSGQFGFALTLTAPLGKENKGLWANLYHYDEKGETLIFETSAKIDEDGNTALRMTHASQYAIVIDEKSHQLPFTDLDENQWYEPAVAYAYRHDIMEGTSPTTFVPDKSLTRAEAVQVLYNLEGKPTVSGNATFPDLAEDWYKPAIAWAESTGVVDGYEDGTFRPDQPVNRMEFAQMLYNYAAYKGYDLTAKGDLTTFPDGSEVQEWALPAMTWANGNELINGHDDGTLEPGGTTTRAQAAAILMRFDQNLAE